MRPTRSRMLVVIVCAFVVTTLAFLGSSIASYVSASDIDKEVSDLLSNALPSVRAVARAHRALRKLRTSTSEAVLAGRPADMDEAHQDLKELDDALDAEAATPWYPGELEIYEEEVAPSLTPLRKAVDDLDHLGGAARDEPALRAAHARLESAMNRTDAALEDFEEVNHDPAFGGAARIVGSRKEVARATLILDFLSTIIAFGAALYAVDFARHMEQVLRRNAELEAERAGELDLVAKRIAHDLVSPLTAVSLSLSAIERKHQDEPTARAVQRATLVLDRCRRMVQGIYAFARSSAQPMPDASAPLRAAVSDAVDTLMAAEGERGLRVEVEHLEEVEVKMERGMLDVVLSNLLSNAAKFTEGCAVRKITVRQRVEATRVHVEVEDTGPGVPPEFAKVIFEPYKRAPGTSQPGLGLGLATVQRLVVAHGGVVGVRNAPSGGAIFWFELPRAPRQGAVSQPAESTERKEVPPGAGPLRPRPTG